jgi:hypothetical protein
MLDFAAKNPSEACPLFIEYLVQEKLLKPTTATSGFYEEVAYRKIDTLLTRMENNAVLRRALVKRFNEEEEATFFALFKVRLPALLKDLTLASTGYDIGNLTDNFEGPGGHVADEKYDSLTSFHDDGSQEVYMVTTDGHILPGIDYKGIMQYLRNLWGDVNNGKDAPPTPFVKFKQRSIMGKVLFDPRITDNLWTEDKGWFLNICPVAPWKKVGAVTPELPPMIKQFIEHHFFPNPEHQQQIYRDLSCLIDGRKQAALGFVGSPGSGKDFMYQIMEGIVGVESSVRLERGHLKGTFNEVLRHKRLVFADDEPIGFKAREYFKNILNDMMTFNRKHLASRKMEKVHHTIVFTNNDYNMVTATNDDRRLSMPDITNKKLTSIWNEEEIGTNRELLKTPEFMAPFCAWLRENHPVTDMDRFTVIKGDTYARIVQASLPEWFRFILDQYEDYPAGFEMPFKELRDETNSHIKALRSAGADVNDKLARLKNVEQLRLKVKEYQKNPDDRPVIDIYEEDENIWIVRKPSLPDLSANL